MQITIKNTLPPDTRVWIYQSTRLFTNDEVLQIEQQADSFVNSWTSHGRTMQAAVEVFFNLFVVVFADEQVAMASGCGIDKSVKFIKDLEIQFSTELLNRMQVAYVDDTKIKFLPLPKFEQQFKEGKVNEQTLVFNNLVNTKSDLTNKWIVPLISSWQYDRVKVSVN